MEGIVLLIISLIIGSFFNGSKNKKEPPKTGAKPFTATGKVEPPAKADDPLKRLKDLSREMYKEIQKELQTEDDEPPSRQTAPVRTKKEPAPSPQVVVAEAMPELPRRIQEPVMEKHRGRLSAHSSNPKPELQSENVHDFFPQNEQDILKGIIFSEILGPPKSKR
ncbi:hypothetical protein OXB_2945 [Bacillus sp. OxB-1]|uniref:hypothetical protein n=1 Tax=Bacillus sp. (strain OxB-1) TaxID=98228 RepID=UPI0005822786|nr:hypothetical protein [Bacillus sp. OxB-1]BAQ11416.1 hypothetical protein OXB_2945 [Bacillus sp. OxB-1]